MAQKRNDELDFQIRFYEEILKEKPDFIEALIAIGDLYTQRGLIDQGLVVDQRLSCLRPDDETILYNLACSYSLIGDVDKAFGAIKLALKNGYSDWGHLQRDRDLALLRRDQRFKDYFAHFCQSREDHREGYQKTSQPTSR